MTVTEVRIKIASEGSLAGYCTVVLDGEFAIAGLRIIDGKGGLFVSMPSQRVMARCRCGRKFQIGSRYCNHCGILIEQEDFPRDTTGRLRLWRDVAHPVSREAREKLTVAVLAAYHAELELSRQPGYVCRYEEW